MDDQDGFYLSKFDSNSPNFYLVIDAPKEFDPEQMEVLEVVSGSGRPSGEVIDELRRGYQRRGKLFRYAQVRVAK